MGLFFASHAAVGFWKVLAVEIKSKKLKTPHASHVFFNSVSLRCVFWNILAVETNS